jgi:hypothetical protein
MKRHTLKWFTNRIGKRIYRKKLNCSCHCCQKEHVDIWDGKEDGKQKLRRDFQTRIL